MKKTLFLLLFLVAVTLLPAQPGGDYLVSNAQEFLDAIGPQRTITLQPGEYDLSSMSGMQGEYYRFIEAYDGMELEISGVSGLVIQGSGHWDSHLITRPRYGYVIRFRGCQGIVLENLKAGHGPETGYCTGGVLMFDGSQGITINDCHLYGSGTEGLTITQSQGIVVEKSIIKSCTYSIMSIDQSQGIVFNKCKFFDNEEFELVNVRQSDGLVFKKCSFNRNQTSGNYLFFSLTETTPPVLKKCSFEGNSAGFFARKEGMLVLKGTRFKGNSWKGNAKYQE